MTKVLVHLHVFYHDQVDYFIDKLKNIKACDWDLVVTYSEYDQTTEGKIKAFRPDVRFLEVENVGYDVWPFIKLLQQTDVSQYGYVMKLHTKGPSSKVYRINGLFLSRYRWRDLLVDAIVGSEARFNRCMRMMEQDADCGFVCAYEMGKDLSKNVLEDLVMLQDEARRIGVSRTDGIYIAGTMFLARMDALKLIKEAEITPAMFGGHDSRSHVGASLAHVYERLLCYAMYDAGYGLRRVVTRPLAAFSVMLHRALAPLLKFTFSLDREGVDRVKVLTLFGFKIALDHGKK